MLLEDPRGIFEKQFMAPLISRAALDEARAGARDDDQRRQRAADDGRSCASLNSKAGVDQQTPEAIAGDFLREHGLTK